MREATGLDISHAAADKISENRLGTFYELALDLRQNLAGPPFQGIKIEPELLDRRIGDFNDYLARARNLSHLNGNDEAGWAAAKQELHLDSEPLTAESIRARTESAERSMVNRIRTLFQDARLDFSYAQLENLGQRWNDIEPILTLVSRYQGRTTWRPEIKALGNIFQAVLENRFENFKFHGNPRDPADQAKALAQLASLKTPEQVEDWKKIRNRVELASPGAADGPGPQQRMQNAGTLITNNLKEHLGNLPAVDEGLKNKILEQIKTPQDPNQTWEAILREDFEGVAPGQAERQVLSSLAHRLFDTTDIDEATRLSQHLRAWSNRLNLETQVRDDIKAIVSALRPSQGSGKPAILFSTTVNDPRTLLTIGDIVATSSCQNYRTGSHIETLPGYVMDAPPQAVVTFAIEQQHFSRKQDFDRLSAALASGKNITSTFDGGHQTTTFEFEVDGQKVRVATTPLGKAFVRHMIRLGAQVEGGGPGLQLEPAYRQTHPSQAKMDAQIREILDEMAREIGATTDQQITSAQSRNEMGTYTDLGGGVVTGDAKIPK